MPRTHAARLVDKPELGDTPRGAPAHPYLEEVRAARGDSGPARGEPRRRREEEESTAARGGAERHDAGGARGVGSGRCSPRRRVSKERRRAMRSVYWEANMSAPWTRATSPEDASDDGGRDHTGDDDEDDSGAGAGDHHHHHHHHYHHRQPSRPRSQPQHRRDSADNPSGSSRLARHRTSQAPRAASAAAHPHHAAPCTPHVAASSTHGDVTQSPPQPPHSHSHDKSTPESAYQLPGYVGGHRHGGSLGAGMPGLWSSGSARAAAKVAALLGVPSGAAPPFLDDSAARRYSHGGWSTPSPGAASSSVRAAEGVAVWGRPLHRVLANFGSTPTPEAPAGPTTSAHGGWGSPSYSPTGVDRRGRQLVFSPVAGGVGGRGGAQVSVPSCFLSWWDTISKYAVFERLRTLRAEALGAAKASSQRIPRKTPIRSGLRAAMVAFNSCYGLGF